LTEQELEAQLVIDGVPMTGFAVPRMAPGESATVLLFAEPGQSIAAPHVGREIRATLTLLTGGQETNLSNNEASAALYTSPDGVTSPLLLGTPGADELRGTTQAERLQGLGGDDQLIGGGFGDTLQGGKGDDHYWLASNDDIVVERADEGMVFVYSSADATLSAYVENLILQGSRNRHGFGNELANSISGNTGNNHLRGMGGDDRLDGGLGADSIEGGAGDDALIGSIGNDILDGGIGFDTAIFDANPDSFRVRGTNVDILTIEGGPLGLDTLINVESIRTQDSTINLQTDLTGLFRACAAGDNYFLIGTAYVGPVSGLERQLFGSNSTEVFGGTGGNDFINLFAGDDAATGGAGDDVIDGGLGSNILSGGTGRDVFFSDGRGGGVTWSTIADWEAGEQLSVWGWRPGVSKILWLDLDGAEDYRGATMRGDLDGDDVFETSVTWSGKARAELPAPFEFDGLLWFVG